MTTRRGKGEGSLYKDSDGLWVLAIEAGRDPLTGKRRRRKVKGRTRAEVVRRGAELRRQIEAGVEAGGASTTLETYARRWLESVVTARVGSENTVENYRIVLERHVLPALGKAAVAKITPEMVDRFLEAKAAQGYSRSYVSRMRSVLGDVLGYAERRGLVRRNAGRLAVMPKAKARTPRRSMTLEEGKALLLAARGHRLEALIVVGLTLGLRPGELTGLLWTDLDLDSERPTLRISGSMKKLADGRLVRGPVKRSTAGERTLALPKSVASVLRQHRSRQAAERLQMGDNWTDHGLVFPSKNGSPLDPSNLRRVFGTIAKRAGIPESYVYLMRHTAASLLVDSGVSIEDAADLLGDDPRTLYRYYRHRVRPVIDAAASPMERMFGSEN